jgi:hypothetical protein
VGSNPAQSIQSSVQIPKSKDTDKRIPLKDIHSPDKLQIRIPGRSCGHIVDYKMRDLYNRAEKFAYRLK